MSGTYLFAQKTLTSKKVVLPFTAARGSPGSVTAGTAMSRRSHSLHPCGARRDVTKTFTALGTANTNLPVYPLGRCGAVSLPRRDPEQHLLQAPPGR